jgi:hypothetical protein
MADVFCLKQIEHLPITSDQIKKTTRQDAVVSQVYEATKNGWPKEISEELKPYYYKESELTISNSCLLWGIHIIVPTKLRETILKELHEGHLGIVKMKSLARNYVWSLWWHGKKCMG